MPPSSRSTHSLTQSDIVLNLHLLFSFFPLALDQVKIDVNKTARIWDLMEEMGVFRAALDPDFKPTVYAFTAATVELGGEGDGDGFTTKEEGEGGEREETMLALAASEVEEKTGLAPLGEGTGEEEEEEKEEAKMVVVPMEIETPRMEEDMEGVVELSV